MVTVHLLLMSLLVFPLDENELLKDFIDPATADKKADQLPAATSPAPATRKKKAEALNYQAGFKSQIDLKCLDSQYRRFEYRVKIENIVEWLKKCQKGNKSSCLILAQKKDPVCEARAESYYKFEMSLKEEQQIAEMCAQKNLKCLAPKKEE